MRTYSSYLTDYQAMTNNTSPANQTFGATQINDSIRTLVGVFFFNEATYTVPGGTVNAQAAYTLPFNNKQVINTTVLIGNVLWQPREVSTRKQYDALNVIPFNNNYPQYYYIYNDQLLIWPTPAENGDAITINYKRRIRNLQLADYTTGTAQVVSGSTAVVGSGTSWTTNMAGMWLNIPLTTSNATSGDNEWYQIASVTNATNLVLMNQYQGASITSTSGGYTIGDVPILPEDFQHLPLYRACYVYYTSVNHNPEKAKFYQAIYDEGYKLLDAEFGSKTSGVGLTPNDIGVVNPNFFQQNISG